MRVKIVPFQTCGVDQLATIKANHDRHSRLSEDRTARLRAGVGSSALARTVVAVVPIATLPISVDVLGVAGYGVWAAINSVTAMMVFSDFGLGTGLMTRLASSPGSVQRRILIASAVMMASALALGLLTMVMLFGWFVNWGDLLGLDGGALNPRWTVIAAFSATVMNILAALINRIQYGVDRVSLGNLWTALGALATGLSMYVASAAGVSANVFIAVVCFVPLLVAGVNWIVFFATSGHELLPSWRDADWSVARSLTGLGLRFMAVSVLIAATTGLDIWIVARTVGVEAAAEYAVPARMLAAVSMITAMVSAPLWPANAEAYASQDLDWIRRTRIRTTLMLGTVVGVAVCCLAAVGPALVAWWLDGQLVVSASLFLAIGIWTWVQALAAPTFMVQNGAEVVWPQLIGYTVFLLVIPIKIGLSGLFGSIAVPLVGTIAYVCVVWPAALYGYRRSMAKAKAT